MRSLLIFAAVWCLCAAHVLNWAIKEWPRMEEKLSEESDYFRVIGVAPWWKTFAFVIMVLVAPVLVAQRAAYVVFLFFFRIHLKLKTWRCKKTDTKNKVEELQSVQKT